MAASSLRVARGGRHGARHVGGVHIAKMPTENAAIANVRTVAKRIVTIQKYEIGIIDQLVATTST